MLSKGLVARIRRGDRSHPDLVRLDSLKPRLSYPGWYSDFMEAETSLHKILPSFKFDDYMFKLQEKQRMFEGDRSHERLLELDSQRFSYPGWQEDIKYAEKIHSSTRDRWDGVFLALIQKMKYNQQIFEARQRRSQETAPTVPSSERSSNECVICLGPPKTHAFIPCGHLCVCGSCAATSIERSDSCPLCRKRAIRVSQIFFS